ncbi:MAG: nitroreductase family protein [Chloroflexi bacterium]|nr:nitroreductase family protein [Chloroflexota bacterium]
MDLMTVDHLLTTTHSVRKRLDFSRPVEPEVLERCIEIAQHAPTGANAQGWHWVVVADAAKKMGIANYYRKSWAVYSTAPRQRAANPNDPRAKQLQRVRDSANYLAEHMHEAPVLVIPCIEGRVENAGAAAQAGLYGSILPAAWSLMLALRARGLGSAWTSLHLVYEKEIAALLGIPAHITQAALLPVAYFTGSDFKPAARLPARERTHWDQWGQRR